MASIRHKLQWDAVEFATGLGVEPAKLAELEGSPRTVPPLVAARARWIQDNQRRLDALATSGLPSCDWADDWEQRRAQLSDPDEILASTAAFEEHFSDCRVCLAQKDYIAERFPPQEPYPVGRMMNLGFKLFDWFEKLSPSDASAPQDALRLTLRNMILGFLGGAVFAGLLLAVPAALGAVFILYAAIFGSMFPLQDIVDAVLFGVLYIGWGAAAGAAGGLVWNLAGGRLGHVLSGVTAMSVFCFLMMIEMEGLPRTWDRFDWYLWGGLSIAFGLALAWGFGKQASEQGA